jgi:hypothetical protein
MRHKWPHKITKRHPIAKCIRCGCYKQLMFPIGVVYCFDTDGVGFRTKSPDCIPARDKE